MAPIRVLIIDDSAVIRGALGRVLESTPDIEACGSAMDGAQGLRRIEELSPDAVILDVEMPGMNGIETLERIRLKWPRLPVIMFSSLTERGARVTTDALMKGASDYCAKPTSLAGKGGSLQQIEQELLPKVRALCGKVAAPPQPRSAPRRPQRRVGLVRPPEVLVVGSSTGGPDALSRFLCSLPGDFRLPILSVQHMPPMFTRLMAERIDSKARLHVQEFRDGQAPMPGQALVAQGGHHMVVENRGGTRVLRMNDGPPENSCRPAVDPLLRSAVEAYDGRVLAVILTGMGSDGLLGCRVVGEAGGQILAQDRESSVVWGMPGYVCEEGLAEFSGTPEQLAQEVLRRVGGNGVPRLRTGS